MCYSGSMIESDVMKMLMSSEVTAKTKTNYEFYLRNWFNWFYEQKPNGDPQEVDAVDVAKWLSTHPRWVSSTRYTAVAALRKFYRWKWGEHPVCQIRIKRIDPGPQRTLDQRELMDVLSTIDTTTLSGIRDLAILSLMVDTGLRASEICNIELQRLDMRKQRLTVLVKGGGLAEKLFFDYTTACLEQWLAVRDKVAFENNKYVFCAVGGKSPGEKMTRSGLRYLTSKLSRLSGVPHFSPHTMRRTFATLATEAGAPSRVVQVAGGWKSIRMVERYTQALKQEAIRPFSPIDKLMGSGG